MSTHAEREQERKTETLALIDARIRDEKRVLAELEARREDELRAQRGRVSELEAIRNTLCPKRRRLRKAVNLDPHVQAGADNVIRMEHVFKTRRVCSQAEVVKEAGVQSGTGTWGIKALLEDGAIEATGEMKGVSKVYRYVGRSRRTRLRPGEGA